MHAAPLFNSLYLIHGSLSSIDHVFDNNLGNNLVNNLDTIDWWLCIDLIDCVDTIQNVDNIVIDNIDMSPFYLVILLLQCNTIARPHCNI